MDCRSNLTVDDILELLEGGSTDKDSENSDEAQQVVDDTDIIPSTLPTNLLLTACVMPQIHC